MFFLGAPEIVTGSKDGTVKLWDPRQKEIPVFTLEPEIPEEKRDCWAVAFGNAHTSEDRTISAGFDNGDLKIIDLRTMKMLWETQLDNGICSMEFDRKDIDMNKLIATTLESTFHLFDMRTFHEKKGYAGSVTKTKAKSTIWSVKHLPQDRDIFMTTSGNGCLNLWKYIYPSNRTQKNKDGTVEGVMGEINSLQDTPIAPQPITCFDWSLDKKGLSACAGIDQTVRIVLVTKLSTV